MYQVSITLNCIVLECFPKLRFVLCLQFSLKNCYTSFGFGLISETGLLFCCMCFREVTSPALETTKAKYCVCACMCVCCRVSEGTCMHAHKRTRTGGCWVLGVGYFPQSLAILFLEPGSGASHWTQRPQGWQDSLASSWNPPVFISSTLGLQAWITMPSFSMGA